MLFNSKDYKITSYKILIFNLIIKKKMLFDKLLTIIDQYYLFQ
ncbi:hypothetical protein GS03_02520 [Flavobacterium sangjuense]|uniref:Uncharacterized protein n=1 Tax=Flavobacterium sangjuense TaxID=2518177 RepID=A0A4P7PVJ8_9FLAO|nr:hypothetical protein GS03_02520 [Flavobacterium sangjuense]